MVVVWFDFVLCLIFGFLIVDFCVMRQWFFGLCMSVYDVVELKNCTCVVHTNAIEMCGVGV